MRLLLPSAQAVAVTLAGLLVVFRAELAAPFALPAGTPHALERRTAVGLAGVGALAAVYLIGSAVRPPKRLRPGRGLACAGGC